MYRWIVFIHVLAALTFFLTHGGSAAVAFQLKKERSLPRIQALLDLSGSTLGVMFISLLVLLVAGVAAGFIGSWWRFGWIWLSIGLLVALAGWMGWYSGRHYNPLRRAAGLPYREGNKDQPAVEPASDEEIAAIAGNASPVLLAAVSVGVTGVILWLMMFKPF